MSERSESAASETSADRWRSAGEWGPRPEPDTLLIPRLARNLTAGTRLALFRKVRMSDFCVDIPQIVALFIVLAGLSVLGEYSVVEAPRGFSVYGVTRYATHELIFIIALCGFAIFSHCRHRLPDIFVSVLSATAGIYVIYVVVYHAKRVLLPESAIWIDWVIYAVFLLWPILVTLRAIRLVSALRLRLLLLPTAGYTGVLVGALFVIPQTPMWYTQIEQEEDIPYGVDIDTEKVYYAQPALMETALNAMQPERPGLSDIYFVGVGSYAYQDVFRKEVEFVRKLMDQRMDTEGRSLVLINNKGTVENVPLANKPNLAAAISGISKRMNTDEDVLLLFLTSHGSEDGYLSSDFWPLEPNPIGAEDLREMLDESNIRWRIVIVSACYSGTFIDALEDDHTAVFTASRRDRNSFGCSNTREMTYFGEHFFARELAKGKSLLESFNAAKDTLKDREIREGFTPSEPQHFMGPAMAEKFAALEARLFANR